MRKPIMQVKDNNDDYFKYKNCFIGYVVGVAIEFETDLSKKEFENFLDGKYNMRQIEMFEMNGRF